MDQSSTDQYLPVADAARLLGLSPLAVRRRCQRQTLDGIKRGRDWYVRLHAADLLDRSLDQSPPDRSDAKGERKEPPIGRERSPASQNGLEDQSAAHRFDQPWPGAITEAVAATAATWQAQLERERERVAIAERQAHEMAAAAAMWQERSRNLEAENAKLQELLALPAYEDPEQPRRRWWQFLRKRG